MKMNPVKDSSAALPPRLEVPRAPGGGSKASRLKVERVENVIDRRTVPGRELLDIKQALLEDLGGAPSLSQAQLLLVDQLVVTLALVEIGSVWALQHALAAFGNNEELIPWLLALDRLQARQERLLVRLGLERKRSPFDDGFLPTSGDRVAAPSSPSPVDTNPALRENEWEDPPEEYHDGDS
jgi:hypothetical protein